MPPPTDRPPAVQLAPLQTAPIMVDGFEHRDGEHCETTALGDIFRFNGLALSEPLLFGLAGALRFIYWQPRYLATPIISGRGTNLVGPLCRRLGIRARAHTTTNRRRARRGVRAVLEQNQPVFLHTDIAMLDYTFVPPDQHFGRHGLVLFGLDPDRARAWVADTHYGVFDIALDTLERARSSRFKPFPPHNRWYTFRFPRRLPPDPEVLARACRAAGRRVWRALSHPPIKQFGLRGLGTLAAELREWPQRYAGETLLQALVNAYLFIEQAGTGGGAFRRLYSRFLAETATLMTDPAATTAYEQAGTAYATAAAAFTSFARSLLPDTVPALRDMRRALDNSDRILRTRPPATRPAAMARVKTSIEALLPDAVAAAPLAFEREGDALRGACATLLGAEERAATALRAATRYPIGGR